MCGIVGYIGNQEASEILLDGLSRLEYRGYDSAGIAVLCAKSDEQVASSKTQIRRAEGKLLHLKNNLKNNPLPPAHQGIAHTRWATHGRPSESNAHPHHYQQVTVVHNGIIENYLELRKELQNKGHEFSSETDSEILAHLICDELKEKLKNKDEIFEAFYRAIKKVSGSFAVAMMHEADPQHLYAARQNSPLVIGLGKEENFVASDVPALLPYTRDFIFLEEGDLVRLGANSLEIFSLDSLEDKQDGSFKNAQVSRPTKRINWSLAMAEKSGFKHFMLKEIFEQPQALSDTLRGHLKISDAGIHLTELSELFPIQRDFSQINKIYLLACGTSWHAALVCRYALEAWSGILVQVEQASEFRYREAILDPQTLIISISQSGETADTLVAVKKAKQSGAKLLCITNVVDSSLARESDAVIYTHAGPEIGVAATKTFTTQLAVLNLIAIWMGKQSGRLQIKQCQDLIHELMEIPQKVQSILEEAPQFKEIALKYSQASHFLFMGRGPQFPIALEGALKLKEISYLHAEGYSAGELKHGPIALIEAGNPVLAIAPHDAYFEKMCSNIQEVSARQAEVIAISSKNTEQKAEGLKNFVEDYIEVPEIHPSLMPILTVIPLQLLAYYIADHKGHDVDQPRNLAKSVTVE